MHRLGVTVVAASLAVVGLFGSAGFAAADDGPRVLPGSPGDIKLGTGHLQAFAAPKA